MLKRISFLAIMLLAVFVMLCYSPIPQSKIGHQADAFQKETASNASLDSAEMSIEQSAALTPEPTPTVSPIPTPYNGADIEPVTAYGFAYHETLNLMSSPADDGTVLLTVGKDAQLTVTGKVGSSYRVGYNDTVGYIPADSFAIASGYINADEVNLRSQANTDCDIISLTQVNTDVIVLSQTEEWFRIVLLDGSNTIGYMHMDYISYPSAYVLTANTVVYTSPDSASEGVETLATGKCVSILCEHNGWYKVETPLSAGYIAVANVQQAPIVTAIERKAAYISSDGVNVRSGASIGFEILDKLHIYAPIYITGEADEWYCIDYTIGEKEMTGYISKDFIELGKPRVYITGQDINLRAGPGTGYDLLTKVRQNSEFVIVSMEGSWLYGTVNGNKGYIRSDLLSTKPVGDGKIDHEFSDDDVYLAAKVVYLEARGKGADAYRAVANVIYNRIKSHKFPNTISGVVYAPNQFTVVRHSNWESVSPNSTALSATRDVLNGGLRPLPLNVLFFHAGNKKNWGSSKEFYKTIGGNSFYRYVG